MHGVAPSCLWDFFPLREDSSSLKALRKNSELKWMHGRASVMSCEKSLVLRERRTCILENFLGQSHSPKLTFPNAARFDLKYISLSFPFEWSCISVCLHQNYKDYHLYRALHSHFSAEARSPGNSSSVKPRFLSHRGEVHGYLPLHCQRPG